ncbi:Uncharacterised protein [uncultured archaeon]|nr:Uncharacterised protein [uncultured archaeon]
MRSAFVSNPARVERALHELTRIEKEFPRHLGWVKDSSAFKLARDMRPNRARLIEIAGRETSCDLVFFSKYRIESDDIIAAYDSDPRYGSQRRGMGGYERWVTDRRLLRARIATAFRYIAADLKSMPSVDLTLKCVGTGSIITEALQPNNLLEIRHSFVLQHVSPATIDIPDLPRIGVGGNFSWMPIWFDFATMARAIARRSSRLQRMLEHRRA